MAAIFLIKKYIPYRNYQSDNRNNNRDDKRYQQIHS